MFTPSCQDKGLLYFPHSSELLRRFPAVFAFHPSVCLFEKQLMIHLAADRTYRIDSCFHLRFIGLQCLDDVPGDSLNNQIFCAYLFTGINSFILIKKNCFFILSINTAIHFQRALIVT